MTMHYQKDLDLLNQETSGLEDRDLKTEKKLKDLDKEYTSKDLEVGDLEIVDNDKLHG